MMQLKGTLGLKLWAEHFTVYPTGCTPKSAWVRTITVDLAGRGGVHIRQPKEIQAQFEALYLLDKSNRNDEHEEEEKEEESENEEHNEDDRSLINTVLNKPADVSVKDAFSLDGRPNEQRVQWITQTVVDLGLSIFNGIDRKSFFISHSESQFNCNTPSKKLLTFYYRLSTADRSHGREKACTTCSIKRSHEPPLDSQGIFRPA